MSQKLEILVKEGVASIRDIQKNPTKALKGITRVIRGSSTIGFFFSSDEMDELFEDIEAAMSQELRSRVKEARKGIKPSHLISLDELAVKYGI
jgi:hypothetical protein